MTTIVTRLFASPDQAAAAAAALKSEDFLDRHVHVIAGDDALAAILDAGVHRSAALIYADRLKQGAGLVVTQAQFGMALKAAKILKQHGPIASGVKSQDVYVGSVDNRPMYPNRYLPILLDNTTVFSGLLLPALTSRNRLFSRMVGLPMLSNKRAPRASLSSMRFSSMLGLPLLTRGKGPRASLITKNTTPFSNAIGAPTLSADRGRRA